MKLFLYVIISTAFLSKSNAQGNAGSLEGSNLRGKGDPIRFACITSNSQSKFHTSAENGSIPSALIKELANGRGLSLYFHGVGYTRGSAFEFLQSFAKEWFSASKNNICIVSYDYKSDVTTYHELIEKIAKSQMLENAAKMARDLVLGVIRECMKSDTDQCLRNLSQVDVSGWSFGAHIAGRTCQFLNKNRKSKTEEKVKLLLALDPPKVFDPEIQAKINDTIRRGDASYVQVIHAEEIRSIWDQIGDVDIYVKFNFYLNYAYEKPSHSKHVLAFCLHHVTSTNRLRAIGDADKSRLGYLSKKSRSTRSNSEIVIGIYGTLEDPKQQGKTFFVTIDEERRKALLKGIEDFENPKDLSGSEEKPRSIFFI